MGENQLFNHMLTSLPGHKWKKIRTMLNPCFTSAKLRGMVPYLDKAARQMVAFLDKQEGQDLDGRDLFGKFTMDALASGGYGLETDSFSDPDNIFRKMALTLAGAPGFAMGHAQDDVHRYRPCHRQVLQDSHVGKDSS